MSLGDSLRPDQTGLGPALSRDVPGGDGAVRDIADPLDRLSSTIDAEFASLYGAAGPEVRVSLTRAAASEGPSAYDRFGTSPDTFGTVVGDRSRAENLGHTLEAYTFSRSIQAAEQAGAVTGRVGNGPVLVESGSPTPTLRVPEQTGYDVLNAVQTIRYSLGETLSNHVTHEDLVTAERAVHGLSREDASAVVGRLSDADLRQWTEELDDRYVLPEFRGYDVAERARLFGGLAQKLDGAQLARFAQALDATGAADDGRAFGAAIGAFTPRDDRVAFVRAIDLKTASPDAVAAVVGAIAGMGPDRRRVTEALAGTDAADIGRLVYAGISRVAAQTQGAGYLVV